MSVYIYILNKMVSEIDIVHNWCDVLWNVVSRFAK